MNLNFNFNEIDDVGAEKLGEGVSKLLNLTTLYLNLSNNEICDEGAAKLGKAISNLLNLIT